MSPFVDTAIRLLLIGDVVCVDCGGIARLQKLRYTGGMQPMNEREPRLATPTTPITQIESQVPLWVLDLLLGIAVILVIAIAISADYGGREEPDATAYLFVFGFGALMLVRRHYPVMVLVATMLLLFTYYAFGYPAIGLAVPVAAALYSAAELGHLNASVVVSILLVVVSTYFRIQDGVSISYLLGYEAVSAVALMAAAIALGDSMRTRRALRAEQVQIARLIEQEHARRAEQQIQAERMRMARDLHDVLSHTISVISLHADVAREAIGHDDEQARQALGHIRLATSQTMRELRATVKLLRNPEQTQAEHSVISLSNLATLVDGVRASGLNIDINVDGDLSALPLTVDTAAYRIIQESLTNVVRHAEATLVKLEVAVDKRDGRDILRIRVVDNGKSVASPNSLGSGIVGMTERARLLGGTFSAQRLPTGGFAVNAELPLMLPEERGA